MALTTQDEIKPGLLHQDDFDVTEDLSHIKGQYIVDNEAKGYVDPTLAISEAENKRLRRKIHMR
jgi:hypothetical protein